MMKISSALLVTLLSVGSLHNVAAVDTSATWNILSLDGGGIRGLITATVVKYMEEFAYEYATEQYCMPNRTNGRVSMAELFDMVAGTSTGSLLATALVFPNNVTNGTPNMYFAQDALDIYVNEAPVVFT
jgi:patatin-like phospholipase/acyl hydrolase